MKENNLTSKKRQEAVTNPNNADDLVLLANISVQAKFLLHSLEQTEKDNASM